MPTPTKSHIRHRLIPLLALLSVCIPCIPSYADNKTVINTKQNLKQLETKITQLQQTLSHANDKRSLLNKELAHTQKKISDTVRELQKMQRILHDKESAIQALQTQVNALNEQLHQQQNLLAKHLRTRYTLGEYQPLKWLLNQDKPDDINRLLTYYQYVMRSNQQVMDHVNATKKALALSQEKLNQEMQAAHHAHAQLQQQQQQFDHDKRYHAALIHALSHEIQTKQQTLESYRRNQANLSRLLRSLAQQSVIQTRHPFTYMRKKLTQPVASHTGAQKINQGIVFFAPEGTPVHAVFPGKIVFSDWLNGYGLLLIVDHGWGFMTLYANNQALFKQKGDTVNQGEAIAAVGHSGTMKQNGLYFEIRHRGKATPPQDWLS